MYSAIDDSGRIVKVRKRHTCEWCGEHIEVGESAIKRTYRFDDDFVDSRMHEECFIALKRYSMESNEDEFIPYGNKRGKTPWEEEDEV